jgi:hypothetical protein
LPALRRNDRCRFESGLRGQDAEGPADRLAGVSDARLDPVIDLSEAIKGSEVVGFMLGPQEEAIVLAATPGDASTALGRHGEAGGPSFADASAKRRYEASLIVVRDGNVSCRELTGLTRAFPIVQPLPDGETLVVGSRAERTNEGHDLNAAVYSAEGVLVREFLLGDGIEDVQTSVDGVIWVSYFDEGVYGNYGWGEPDGPPPIGANGLTRFDRLGAIEWEFDPPADQAIDDCYALNVANGVAWAYYYSSFPLVRISGDEIETWTTPVGGARAVAIRGDTTWLVGGYGSDRTRCVVCRFGKGQLVEQERFTLTTASGELSRAARIAARGQSIYALDGTTLYRA